MDHRLSAKEYTLLSSMLFGLFFGAGNLIFPVLMGQQAGAAVWPAVVGFCLTGVGLPLLGIAALGLSRSEGLFEMAGRVGPRYRYFFTCLLYLSIGPLFAIPRTATVPFSVGVQPLLGSGGHRVALCVFSALFFIAVLYFSLRPSGILTWVGRFLNPLFLLFLGILTVTALLRPMGSAADSAPVDNYAHMSFFQGFLDGYNTMDALASLAFGIVLVNTLRSLGVRSPRAISVSTVKAGVFSTILMAGIYCILALVGAQSRAELGLCADGGEILYRVAAHYFGTFGGVLLGITVTFACLKTAIGLITACASTFVELFPHSFSYRTYTIVFCLFAFGIANFGLSRIIQLSVPLLMFLYPLTITLIALCLSGGVFSYDRRVFLSVTVFTAIAAALDFLAALPAGAQAVLHVQGLLLAAERILPFFSYGLGWVVPALIGLAIGLLWRRFGPAAPEAPASPEP